MTIRDIGKGFRWYDIPYLLLRPLQYSKLAVWLPARLRIKICDSANFLYQTHHTRWRRGYKAAFHFDRIEVPVGESVLISGVWIAEYFTPSGVRSLYDAIRGFGWDGGRFLGMDPGGTH
ncbi:hypothetical protein [Cryobacterium sp. PH31-O1]|uniref:hypothetical protein n=1 Tax=Cryobacterium sp. PH31-O1 TaxID=3046306 RepID=UPI0024B92C02|nr:hypothetical protein [Cryobacterium sp. PH31-O1]MDJ0337924.1 hypothetical protein [Cryobacterium sp. PH31-O1]